MVRPAHAIVGCVIACALSVGAGMAYAASRLHEIDSQSTRIALLSNGALAGTHSIPAVVNRSLPARLIIPKINVDAATSYAGLTKSGDVDAPKDIAKVSWYKYGALPGNAGSAVIAGHVNGLHGEPGVFKNIDTLKAGDTFMVADDRGQRVTFTVESSRIYSHDEQATEVFKGDSKSRLNLITCTGQWNRERHSYNQRLVVFGIRSTPTI